MSFQILQFGLDWISTARHESISRLRSSAFVQNECFGNSFLSRCFVRVRATHVKTHKLLQVCKQVVRNLFTSCQQVVFALLVPSCCKKFGTSCQQLMTSLMALSDLLQVCSNKSDTVMIRYNKNVTRL